MSIGDLWGGNTYVTNGSTTDDWSLEKALQLMRELEAKEAARKLSRDEMFSDYRLQGIVAFALDCGQGEEWVLDDRLVDALQGRLEEKTSGPLPGPVSAIAGVRVIRYSEWSQSQ